MPVKIKQNINININSKDNTKKKKKRKTKRNVKKLNKHQKMLYNQNNVYDPNTKSMQTSMPSHGGGGSIILNKSGYDMTPYSSKNNISGMEEINKRFMDGFNNYHNNTLLPALNNYDRNVVKSGFNNLNNRLNKLNNDFNYSGVENEYFNRPSYDDDENLTRIYQNQQTLNEPKTPTTNPSDKMNKSKLTLQDLTLNDTESNNDLLDAFNESDDDKNTDSDDDKSTESDINSQNSNYSTFSEKLRARIANPANKGTISIEHFTNDVNPFNLTEDNLNQAFDPADGYKFKTDNVDVETVDDENENPEPKTLKQSEPKDEKLITELLLPMNLSQMNKAQLDYINENDKFLHIRDIKSKITKDEYLKMIKDKLFIKNEKNGWINKRGSLVFDIPKTLMTNAQIEAGKKLQNEVNTQNKK